MPLAGPDSRTHVGVWPRNASGPCRPAAPTGLLVMHGLGESCRSSGRTAAGNRAGPGAGRARGLSSCRTGPGSGRAADATTPVRFRPALFAEPARGQLEDAGFTFRKRPIDPVPAALGKAVLAPHGPPDGKARGRHIPFSSRPGGVLIVEVSKPGLGPRPGPGLPEAVKRPMKCLEGIGARRTDPGPARFRFGEARGPCGGRLRVFRRPEFGVFAPISRARCGGAQIDAPVPRFGIAA